MSSVHNFLVELCAYIACIFVGVLGLIILWKILTNQIDLTLLISEPTPDHDASMSRFQLLVFTFVVAISMLKMIEVKNEFPVIPNGVLTLLGISASTYAVGKGIQFSKNGDKKPTGEETEHK